MALQKPARHRGDHQRGQRGRCRQQHGIDQRGAVARLGQDRQIGLDPLWPLGAGHHQPRHRQHKERQCQQRERQQAKQKEGLTRHVIVAPSQNLSLHIASANFGEIAVDKGFLRGFHLTPVDAGGAGIIAVGQELGADRSRQFDRPRRPQEALVQIAWPLSESR
jgi:hypothetical protein